MFDCCLSKEARRAVYDKFVALLGGTSLLALHRHYAPLGERALVGLFIAGESQAAGQPAASSTAA